MLRALILGGTKGLGLALASEAHKNKTTPIICGRSASSVELREVFLSGAEYMEVDLTNEQSIEMIDDLQHERIDYFFWVAGIFLRKPVREMAAADRKLMIATHLDGPIDFLQRFHKRRSHPYHLITIASTSSWRLRENESLYCAVKAGKAAFTRNFGKELIRDLPGSKVTLVNPGGMATPNFWQGSGQDTSNFMDPKKVAEIIWEKVLRQKKNFAEFQIFRNEDGSPQLKYGPRKPEVF